LSIHRKAVSFIVIIDNRCSNSQSPQFTSVSPALWSWKSLCKRHDIQLWKVSPVLVVLYWSSIQAISSDVVFEVVPQALVQGEPEVARKARIPGAKTARPKTALQGTIMMPGNGGYRLLPGWIRVGLFVYKEQASKKDRYVLVSKWRRYCVQALWFSKNSVASGILRGRKPLWQRKTIEVNSAISRGSRRGDSFAFQRQV
jgi:hypothetical protein